MARILVVDDEEQIRNLLRTILVRAGHEVQTAADPETAVEMCCASAGFDLVLSDVIMSSVGGHELARVIAERCPDTQVVLMSAVGTPCEECPYSPRCKLIAKPFEAQEVVATIAESLALASHLHDWPTASMNPVELIANRLRMQMLSARASFDFASEKLARLAQLFAEEAATLEGIQVLNQARRIHHAAQQLYQLSLQRFSDFVRDGVAPQDMTDEPS